ncbi:hypothetical protein VNO77_03134 [Canavalia gladiata]|uniref:Uncharacterized protein n=1 Tax=Canavalia gladiata TaxID=3824 RepID=A0AAN9MZC8_CANGL
MAIPFEEAANCRAITLVWGLLGGGPLRPKNFELQQEGNLKWSVACEDRTLVSGYQDLHVRCMTPFWEQLHLLTSFGADCIGRICKKSTNDTKNFQIRSNGRLCTSCSPSSTRSYAHHSSNTPIRSRFRVPPSQAFLEGNNYYPKEFSLLARKLALKFQCVVVVLSTPLPIIQRSKAEIMIDHAFYFLDVNTASMQNLGKEIAFDHIDKKKDTYLRTIDFERYEFPSVEADTDSGIKRIAMRERVFSPQCFKGDELFLHCVSKLRPRGSLSRTSREAPRSFRS